MPRPIINQRVNREWFKARMKERGLTNGALGKALGIGRTMVSRSFTGHRFFTAEQIGQISILLQQPFTHVAFNLGIEFYQPNDEATVTRKMQEAYDAMKALARAFGLKT